MEFAHLKHFEAVARLGTLPRAACETNTSVSTLSRSIAALETELGCQLFDRVGHSLVLNTHGKATLGTARAMLARMEALKTTLHGPTDPARTLTLHVATTASTPAWHLLAQTAERFGHVQLEFVSAEANTHALVAALREGTAHLAIAPSAPTEPDIAATPLMTEQLQLSVPATHPLAATTATRTDTGITFAEVDAALCATPATGDTGATPSEVTPAPTAPDAPEVLLYDPLGTYWHTQATLHLPHATITPYASRERFDVLLVSTAIPALITTAPAFATHPAHRTRVPLAGPATHVQYYLLAPVAAPAAARDIFAWIEG